MLDINAETVFFLSKTILLDSPSAPCADYYNSTLPMKLLQKLLNWTLNLNQIGTNSLWNEGINPILSTQ